MDQLHLNISMQNIVKTFSLVPISHRNRIPFLGFYPLPLQNAHEKYYYQKFSLYKIKCNFMNLIFTNIILIVILEICLILIL